MLGDKVPGLISCRKCQRLVRHIASLPPRKGLTCKDYWNGPVPGFGDPLARICLIGLAPGAHGANRTGRPFTGDGAGDFMYPLLHRAGLTSQREALHAGDGLTLQDLYITNAVKCLPPDNRPVPDEFVNCTRFLADELASLSRLKVVLLLGQGAFSSYLRLLRSQGIVQRIGLYPFAHGAVYRPEEGPFFVASYHTSRYNLQTGRISEAMFLKILETVRSLAEGK
jgi:uracil-DNA glycosylase